MPLSTLCGGAPSGTGSKAFKTKPRLHYFDFDGGRGEAARLAFHLGGIEFDDVRLKPADWGKVKAGLQVKDPRALPVLEVDGQKYSQSLAILRYVGKACALYPDGIESLLVDEVMDSLEELVAQAPKEKDKKKQQAARKEFQKTKIEPTLDYIESIYARSKGPLLLDSGLSVADLMVFNSDKMFKSGMFDFVDTDLISKRPGLAAAAKAVAENNDVVSYYAMRKEASSEK